VWLAGTLAVLAVWLVRWYRISAIAKRATPLRAGAEAEIVARLQAGDSLRRKVEIVSTTEAIEPGIFGSRDRSCCGPPRCAGKCRRRTSKRSWRMSCVMCVGATI